MSLGIKKHLGMIQNCLVSGHDIFTPAEICDKQLAICSISIAEQEVIIATLHKQPSGVRVLNLRRVFWSLTASLAGFLFGFDTVVISGAEKAIEKLW